MSNLPARPTPANPLPPRRRTARRLRNFGLIGAVFLLYVATTGAAIGPDSSRLEVTMYSLGYALALIVVLRIVVKLFLYLLQAATVLAVLGLLYLLVRMAINGRT